MSSDPEHAAATSANVAAAEKVLADYGKTVDDLKSKMLLFGSGRGL